MGRERRVRDGEQHLSFPERQPLIAATPPTCSRPRPTVRCALLARHLHAPTVSAYFSEFQGTSTACLQKPQITRRNPAKYTFVLFRLDGEHRTAAT